MAIVSALNDADDLPQVRYVITAKNSKIDLAIIVAIIGALLGSGLVLNVINMATRKSRADAAK